MIISSYTSNRQLDFAVDGLAQIRIVCTNLVLDEELDTLNGGSGGLGDRSGDTAHHEINHEVLYVETALVHTINQMPPDPPMLHPRPSREPI